MVNCTIITVWNSQQMFQDLKDDLSRQQNVCYTLLDIDNRENRYDGIRKAFNDCICKVQTEYVLFLHQDIQFLHELSLHNFVSQLQDLGKFGVVGVAGCPKGPDWKILSNILHGEEKAPAGEPVNSAAIIQSVDECMFAMPAEVLRKIPFSTLGGWHLYAVEQCIRSEKLGLNNYVIAADVYHLSSGGSLDPSYITALLQLKDAYFIEDGLLNTTVKQWDLATKKGLFYIRYYYWKQKCKRLCKSLGLLKG